MSGFVRDFFASDTSALSPTFHSMFTLPIALTVILPHLAPISVHLRGAMMPPVLHIIYYVPGPETRITRPPVIPYLPLGVRNAP
jgi:hypothetical protein